MQYNPQSECNTLATNMLLKYKYSEPYVESYLYAKFKAFIGMQGVRVAISKALTKKDN
jgi:hypothetical protein